MSSKKQKEDLTPSEMKELEKCISNIPQPLSDKFDVEFQHRSPRSGVYYKLFLKEIRLIEAKRIFREIEKLIVSD